MYPPRGTKRILPDQKKRDDKQSAANQATDYNQHLPCILAKKIITINSQTEPFFYEKDGSDNLSRAQQNHSSSSSGQYEAKGRQGNLL